MAGQPVTCWLIAAAILAAAGGLLLLGLCLRALLRLARGDDK